MKKLILVVFLFVIISNACYAISAKDINCRDNGVLGLTFSEAVDFHPYLVNIHAKYELSNVTFDVHGKWNLGPKTNTYNQSFSSDERLFNNSGTYDIVIEYQGQKIELNTSCPGLEFCYKGINIETCSKTNGYLYLIFNAPDIDPYRDIQYSISSRERVWSGSPIENSTIMNMGNNSYQLSYFVGENTTIINAFIRKINCIFDNNWAKSSKICIIKNNSCENDSQCFLDETCNTKIGRCEIIECDKGHIVNRKCIECDLDIECNDRLKCTDDLCIDNKCVHRPTVCKSEDPCLIGTCEESTGCKYSIDEKCSQAKVLKGQNIENVQFIQLLSEDDIQKELDDNLPLKKDIESMTGRNITPSYIKRVALLMPEISRRIQLQRSIRLEDNKTIMALKAKYLGDSNMEKLVIYDELPKMFAENASSITVKAPGGFVKIIKEDPSFAIFYPKIDPLKEWYIEFSVDSNLDVSVLNQTKSPLLLAENIEGYDPNNLLYLYGGIGTLIVLLFSFGVYSMRKPKETVIKKTVGGFSKEADRGLILNKISLKHKDTKILDNVSFSVRKESLCSIIGLSGSGKSMVIETIAGRKLPNEGYIEVLGENIKTKRQEINRLVGFVPQHPELYMNETVWQNMLNSITKWDVKDGKSKSENILKQLNLLDKKDLKAKNLSGGQLKLLSLGTELLRDPKVLLLDEPTTGLDPSTRSKIMTILTNLVDEEGKTIIFSSHFMDEIEDCDQVIIIHKGKLLVSGSPSSLKKMMPCEGKIIVVTLNKVNESIVKQIEGIKDVDRIITDGKSLRLITHKPDIVSFSKSITDIGASISEIKVIESTMKDVFIYFTGEEPHD